MVKRARLVNVGAAESALLTVDEVADLLGLGRARVWAMVGKGQIKSIKVGRARRVVRADFDQFVEDLRTGRIDGSTLAGPNHKNPPVEEGTR